MVVCAFHTTQRAMPGVQSAEGMVEEMDTGMKDSRKLGRKELGRERKTKLASQTCVPLASTLLPDAPPSIAILPEDFFLLISDLFQIPVYFLCKIFA